MQYCRIIRRGRIDIIEFLLGAYYTASELYTAAAALKSKTRRQKVLCDVFIETKMFIIVITKS